MILACSPSQCTLHFKIIYHIFRLFSRGTFTERVFGENPNTNFWIFSEIALGMYNICLIIYIVPILTEQAMFLDFFPENSLGYGPKKNG